MKMLNRIIGGSMAAAAAFVLSASNTQAAPLNLLVNGSFEDAGGFTANPLTTNTVNQGWALFGATVRTNMYNSNDSPQDGSYALLEQNGPGNNWNPAGAYQVITNITPGVAYTYSVWVLRDTTITWSGGGVDIQLGFRNADLSTNGLPGQLDIDGWNAIPKDTWTLLSRTLTAPAGAADAIMYCMFMDNAQTGTEQVFFDNATLVPEPSSLALLGMGLAVPFYFIRRRKS